MISKLYGHSNVLVTQRYLHPNDALSQEAVESLVQHPVEKLENGENLSHRCHTGQHREKASLPLSAMLSRN